ncbi:MAG: hypothetical protein ACREJB_18330 [Planctomycetaceae bacterium]
MTVNLSPELERRLEELAGRRSIAVKELVEQVLEQWLASAGDAPSGWVEMTQKRLTHVWPEENPADCKPPNAGH